jgi:hypothetical protein
LPPAAPISFWIVSALKGTRPCPAAKASTFSEMASVFRCKADKGIGQVVAAPSADDPSIRLELPGGQQHQIIVYLFGKTGGNFIQDHGSSQRIAGDPGTDDGVDPVLDAFELPADDRPLSLEVEKFTPV